MGRERGLWRGASDGVGGSVKFSAYLRPKLRIWQAHEAINQCITIGTLVLKAIASAIWREGGKTKDLQNEAVNAQASEKKNELLGLPSTARAYINGHY